MAVHFASNCCHKAALQPGVSSISNRYHVLSRPSSRKFPARKTFGPLSASPLMVVAGSPVAVVLAEGFYTRSQLPDSAKGRPGVLALLGCTAGLVAALALVSAGGGETKTGLIVGTATSAVLLLLYIRRALEVVGSSREWPGPKVWPAGMALASFFAVQIFMQGLFRA